MDIQEAISKAAEEYDPDYEIDAAVSQALLQGTVYGLMLKAIQETPEGQIPRVGACSVSNIIQGQDAQGVYLPYFTVRTGAGHKIRISFEVET